MANKSKHYPPTESVCMLAIPVHWLERVVSISLLLLMGVLWGDAVDMAQCFDIGLLHSIKVSVKD